MKYIYKVDGVRPRRISLNKAILGPCAFTGGAFVTLHLPPRNQPLGEGLFPKKKPAQELRRDRRGSNRKALLYLEDRSSKVGVMICATL